MFFSSALQRCISVFRTFNCGSLISDCFRLFQVEIGKAPESRAAVSRPIGKGPPPLWRVGLLLFSGCGDRGRPVPGVGRAFLIAKEGVPKVLLGLLHVRRHFLEGGGRAADFGNVVELEGLGQSHGIAIVRLREAVLGRRRRRRRRARKIDRLRRQLRTLFLFEVPQRVLLPTLMIVHQSPQLLVVREPLVMGPIKIGDFLIAIFLLRQAGGGGVLRNLDARP